MPAISTAPANRPPAYDRDGMTRDLMVMGAAATSAALVTLGVAMLVPADKAPVVAPAPSFAVASAEPPPEVTVEEFRLPRVAERLRREEVREVQKRLWGFGFNPGPLDGAAGPRTQAAAVQYRRHRGVTLATDAVDYDLLDRLRHDPAARVAYRAPRRSSNPFDEFARWFQSIGK